MRDRVSRLPVSLLLSALLAGACAIPLDDRSARQRSAQESQARRLVPARLQPPQRNQAAGQAAPDVIATARVRVYAGDAHRAQSRRWAERFREQVDAANQYLIPAFGIRLEIVESLPWSRQAPADDLGAMLAELEARDAGTDVHWVVGLVTSLSSTTPSFHQLGMARPLGRHMILRGYDDLEERKAIETALDRLSEAERADLLEARRQHRQAVVLLHEWAHTLGAMHETATATLMSETYTTTAAAFSPETTDLIRTVLAARLGASGSPDQVASDSRAAEVVALVRHLDSTSWSGWIDADRTELQQMLAAYQDSEGATGDGSQALAGIPAEARALYLRVHALAAQGRPEEAQAELDGLLAAYPAHAGMRLTACELALARQGASETATGHCLRVAELDPGEPRGELTLAGHHARAGENARAGEILDRLRARIPAMTREQDRAWHALVAMYQGMNAVTWTEQAVAAAPPSVDAGEAARWATRLRRRYGLPPRAARHRILPADEGVYVQVVRGVLDRVYAGKHEEAQAEARKGLRAFPDAPGILGALCDLELRRGRHGAARGHCQRALAVYGEASWARYLLGIIELHDRRTAAGIRHLEQAIALDPDLHQAYHALDKALARRADTAARARLQETYRERFGRPMPR